MKIINVKLFLVSVLYVHFTVVDSTVVSNLSSYHGNLNLVWATQHYLSRWATPVFKFQTKCWNVHSKERK